MVASRVVERAEMMAAQRVALTGVMMVGMMAALKV